jgi:hypothetical protein
MNGFSLKPFYDAIIRFYEATLLNKLCNFFVIENAIKILII